MADQKYRVGDVVNLYCPNQEDPKQSTFRPVIIAEDLLDEIYAVFVTCQTKQSTHYDNSFVILENSAEGNSMGLTCDALICPSRTANLRKVLIHPPKRGVCPDSILDRILEHLS